MRDGIELARRGLAAVALVTTAFVAQGDFVARAAGMPGVPRVVLPHPVAGRDDAAMAVVAKDAAAAIRGALEGRAP